VPRLEDGHVGLYNMVFASNPEGPALLALLGLDKDKTGRYRDAWVTDEAEIAVYTRNGGGNRECWTGDEEGHQPRGLGAPDCGRPGCYACIITHRLPRHPLYLRDKDDTYDNTYATIYFRIPDDVTAATRQALRAQACTRDMNVEWRKAIDELRKNPSPEMLARMAPMIDTLKKIIGE